MTDEVPTDQYDSAAKTRRRRPGSGPVRGRILRSTAVLPGVFTISNGLLGFAAIHFATKGADGFEAALSNQAVACWLIFAAMICDMLDGRLARMTRRTSDFGGQLDSMCDVISFGVAPAMVMVQAVLLILGEVPLLSGNRLIERAVWAVAAVYVACAVLRLARFNVENEPDESAHMDFKGLPVPGAAAAVASLVMLFEHLQNTRGSGWLSTSWLKPEWFAVQWILIAVCVAIPVVTLLSGLLMVSRFRYAHLVNQYVRGKRPFGYLVKLLVVALAAVLEPLITLAAAAIAFAASGPAGATYRRLHGPKRQQATDPFAEHPGQ